MKLIELVDDTKTDKNTVHSYLNLYEELLNSKKDSAKNILEIGMGGGGSIKLWHDYFVNATIHGIDIVDNHELWGDIKNNNRIMVYSSTNAYSPEFVNKAFIDNNKRFDMILDDGPHSLDSMIKYIHLYSNLMTENGILIIEDVQSINWIEILKQNVPNDLKKYVEVYDLRHIKNRWDDIVFVINKK
jgi:hypothetical protein